MKRYFDTAPNDTRYDEQWAHANMESAAAWDITTGSTDVTIAIIDTGVDTGHPDLAAKIVAGYDFVDSDADPTDENGHGTHCAGIAAAITNNGAGVAGMDWSARVMPVRVLNEQGSGSVTDITNGIIWAYTNGADVLSLSLGGSGYSQTAQDAVNAAHAAGSIVIAAMGNCRTYDPPYCPQANPTNYPAAYTNVMAVAATNRTDDYAYYSQYGPHCDIAAPGGETYIGANGILSTLPTYACHLTTHYGYNNNYDYLQGTSMATPYVSGLAALVWAASPTLTPDGVQQVIQDTADDLGDPGRDNDFGYGRINALAALQSISAPIPPTLLPINNDGDYMVDWSDVPDVINYTLQEDDNSSFTSPTVLYSGPDSYFQVTDQESGIWYYRVRASNDLGDGDWSNIQSVGVVPAAPALDSISNAGNNDEYQVSWSAVPGAAGYTLEQDDNPSFISPTVRYMGTALEYNVTGQPGGTWHYQVRAYSSAGDGDWSGSQSTTVNPAALDAPELLSIDNAGGDKDYVVNWYDVSGADNYMLEESSDTYFAGPAVVYTGTALQHMVTNQPGGAWYYRVRAFGAAGDSPWGSQQSATVRSSVYFPLVVRNFPPLPDTPTLNTISNGDGDGNYSVSWGTAEGAETYTLQEDDNSNFSSPTAHHTDDSLAWAVLDQPTGTYYYQVRATNSWGDSGWSNTQSVTVQPACVPDPTGESDNIDDALAVCSGQTVSGQVSDSDRDDVYKILTEANQYLTISLNGSGGDADLYLYPPDATDVNTDPYVAGSNSSGNDELIQGTVNVGGFWYIDVYSYEGTTNYNVTVTLSGPAAAGSRTFSIAVTNQAPDRQSKP